MGDEGGLSFLRQFFQYMPASLHSRLAVTHHQSGLSNNIPHQTRVTAPTEQWRNPNIDFACSSLEDVTEHGRKQVLSSAVHSDPSSLPAQPSR